MAFYRNFIGIDIGKYEFVTHIDGRDKTVSYENTPTGIASFISEHEEDLKDDCLCLLETTGGYEMELLLTLSHGGYAVHRANTRKLKNFIRSYGHGAKTDALDAKALSLYGKERHERLSCYDVPSDKQMALYELVTRVDELKGILVAEKNRLKSPRNTAITEVSCRLLIETLDKEIERLSTVISTHIAEDSKLSAKQKILVEIPGIGQVVSTTLLVLLPELGTLNRREIAALVGLAPRANDSGCYRGYRSTGHGRQGIKPKLFLSAMAARNSNSSLKIFYEQLVGRGKQKKVALTALMRKILVIANARMRDYQYSLTSPNGA